MCTFLERLAEGLDALLGAGARLLRLLGFAVRFAGVCLVVAISAASLPAHRWPKSRLRRASRSGIWPARGCGRRAGSSARSRGRRCRGLRAARRRMLLDLEPADEVAEAIRRGRWRKPEPLLEPVEDVAGPADAEKSPPKMSGPQAAKFSARLGGGNQLRLGR